MAFGIKMDQRELTRNKREKTNGKLYSIAFHAMQLIGLVAFILSWVFDLPGLVLITFIAMITSFILLMRFGIPSSPENPEGLMQKYINFKRFLFGKHYVLHTFIFTQVMLATIWLVVILKSNPPRPFSVPGIVLAIILSDILLTAAALIGVKIGKVFRDKHIDKDSSV